MKKTQRKTKTNCACCECLYCYNNTKNRIIIHTDYTTGGMVAIIDKTVVIGNDGNTQAIFIIVYCVKIVIYGCTAAMSIISNFMLNIIVPNGYVYLHYIKSIAVLYL